ncbi:MAG TPA: NusG domain II-containing protein [Clostridia bacterium]|nr:NusG domain II-containing protein [Clostridia bacterium]
MTKLIKRADLILIACVLVVCSIFFVPKCFPTNEKLIAVVFHDGSEVMRVNLSDINESYEKSINGDLTVTIEFNRNSVRFTHSECPDKLCMLTGALKHKGEIATCLPAGIVIVVEGSGKYNLDAITY